MTRKEQILKNGRSAGLSTQEIKTLLDLTRDEEQRYTDKVYGFFREHLKNDQKMMDFARHHYEGYLKNDPDYPTFESWFKDCYYDMSGTAWKEGVESWLGELHHNGELDQYLKDIKLKEFVDSMDGNFEVQMGYTEGHWIMIDPRVHIEVNILAD